MEMSIINFLNHFEDMKFGKVCRSMRLMQKIDFTREIYATVDFTYRIYVTDEIEVIDVGN